MIPLFPLFAAVLSLLTSVNGLGLISANGRTDLVIRVDGQVTVKDYRLGDPERLVIDVFGAHKALTGDRFDRIDRGGVKAIRISQFQPEVVRVVVDLAGRVQYVVDRRTGEVHVSFPNPGADFQPWSVGAGAAPVAAVPVQPRSAPVRTAAAPPPPSAKRITATFEKTPILDVLSTFSDFSGKSIIAGNDVTGDVTASIHDQPWDVALIAILRAQSLASEELPSGIIAVQKMDKMREREKNEELVTRQFKIRYVAVDSLYNAIKGMVSERGKVTTSASSNTLVISDAESVVRRIEPLVNQLDVRTPQITIAAKILFVDRTALQGLGVVYDLKDSRGNQLNTFTPGFVDENGDGIFDSKDATSENVISLGGNSIAALANATSRLETSTLQMITSLVLGRHTLLTFLEALQSLSLSDIQAAPVVTVMDNRSAKIQVGEQTPVRVIDVGSMTQQGGGQGGLQAPRATVQFRNTGVILDVTPHVTGDHILLEMHAERSQAVASAGDAGVTFQTQEATTQVTVKDGETAVVGGLTLIEKIRSRTGIPVLMDVPVLGALFRKTEDSEHKRDLLIMVTPHIMNEGA